MNRAQWRRDTLRTKEPATVAWIEAMPAGAVFWDIGANIGIYSLLAASRGIMTVAVEPLPANYGALVRAIMEGGYEDRILPVCAALSNKNCASYIAFERNEEGYSTGAGREIGCLKATVDTLTRAFEFPRPTHIKIDTDGSDWRVLCGATASLKTVVSVIIETDIGAADRDNITALLETEGFEMRGRYVCPLYPNSSTGMDHWYRKDSQ